MNPIDSNDPNELIFLESEIKNFGDIYTHIKPSSGEISKLDGIDIYGEVIPFNGISGGDHIIFVNFNKRYDMDLRIEEALQSNRPEVAKKLEAAKHRAGILIADVAGHQITDSALAAMLHQAFLIGVLYELNQFGEITPQLFENLNTRFFNSSSVSKFITLIYGEISDKGKFRFLNAGHPTPYVFSKQFNKMVKICFKRVVNLQPIGTLPSKDDIDVKRNFSYLGFKKRYTTNEINLMGSGDILILYTDGLSEHSIDMKSYYFPTRLQKILQKVKEKNAREIFYAIKDDMLKFALPSDDISYVIIKRVD